MLSFYPIVLESWNHNKLGKSDYTLKNKNGKSVLTHMSIHSFYTKEGTVYDKSCRCCSCKIGFAC